MKIERNAFCLSHVELPEPEIAQWQIRKQKTQNKRRAQATLAALGAIACIVLAMHFHHIHNDNLTGAFLAVGSLCLGYSVTQLLRNNRTKEETQAFWWLYDNPEKLIGQDIGSDYSKKVDLVWKYLDAQSSMTIAYLRPGTGWEEDLIKLEKLFVEAHNVYIDEDNKGSFNPEQNQKILAARKKIKNFCQIVIIRSSRAEKIMKEYKKVLSDCLRLYEFRF